MKNLLLKFWHWITGKKEWVKAGELFVPGEVGPVLDVPKPLQKTYKLKKKKIKPEGRGYNQSNAWLKVYRYQKPNK